MDWGAWMAPDLQQELSTFTVFAASLEQGEKDIRMKDNVWYTHKDESERDTRNVTYWKDHFRLLCPLPLKHAPHCFNHLWPTLELKEPWPFCFIVSTAIWNCNLAAEGESTFTVSTEKGFGWIESPVMHEIVPPRKLCLWPNPRYLWMWPYLKIRSYRRNQAKMRWQWIRMGLSQHDWCPYEKQGRDIRRTWCDNWDRDWSDASTSQKMSRAVSHTRS